MKEINNSAQENKKTLQRNLKNRHIQLIALGGAIGTGLFLASGRVIELSGPSILLSYAIGGIALFFVMRALGELLLSNLKYKSFTDIATAQMGPMAGFFVGWSYWMCWVTTGILETIAVTEYWHYWWPATPAWVVATVFISSLMMLNLLSVRIFGELEFWFGLIKLVAIVVLIICGLVLISIHYQNADGTHATVTNLWQYGGIFPNGFNGFLLGIPMAMLSFIGAELVGTTAAEASNPEKTLPRAINAIPLRISIFYLGALLIIIMVTPWSHVNPHQSPFVQLFDKAGFSAAASIVNFVVLLAAASATNSGLYSTSRMLYGLALDRSAHSSFIILSKSHVPYFGLVFSSLCLFIGVFILYLNPEFNSAFGMISSCVTILFIFTWAMIVVSYLIYRRKQKALHQASLFKLPGGILTCFGLLLFFVLILIQLAMLPSTRIGVIATPIWFIFLAIVYVAMGRWKRKTNHH